MIYVDSSVLLAELFAEDRSPTPAFWALGLVSSRLLEYEVWTIVNGRRLRESYGDAARALLGRVELLDLTSLVLNRALEPFPVPLRTLDALHVASADYVRAAMRERVDVASYDRRLTDAARAVGLPIYDL